MQHQKLFTKISQKLHLKNEVNLLSFSPQKASDRNIYLVKQLKRATSIFNRHDNNIALEGDYGTGKSSILRQLKEQPVWWLINKPKTISFFAFTDKRSVSNIKMQSEIVRQLYFGENANKLKGSSYKRIGRHYYWLSIAIALLLGISVISNLLDTNISSILDGVKAIISTGIRFDRIEIVKMLIWATSVIIVAIISNMILRLFSNATIRSISAKDLSVELLDKRPDFDQLIDLLVFYFENTKRRVLIFEDLDRFNEPKIFEELHQLNSILNSRLRLLGKIKFIYATKDDLFSKSASSEANIENIRTKVFDLIIPVVPFLSEMNYDVVFRNEYDKAHLKHDVAGIEKILSRHSSDMRVIKAIINYMIVYDRTFKLESKNDYKNCAALSVIRMFKPSEFKKLSTASSSLNKILEACRKQKSNKLKEIEDKYTAEYKIKNHSNEIWAALKANGEAVPAGYQLQTISIDGNVYTSTDQNTLIKMLNTRSNVRINWAYKEKIFTPDQIKEIFNRFTTYTSEELQDKERELRCIAERNPFEYYDEIKTDLENDPEIPTIITELVENGFITEDYLRFTAKSASNDVNINSAKRYIFNYIRGKERDASYGINSEMAKYILKEIDNTDLSSTGLYNFDLLDYIIRNQDKYHDHLERLLLNSVADIEKFMAFFDSYCRKYKTKLENESYIGLNDTVINDLSKIIPPVYLTRELAKVYPENLLRTISNLSLGDTNAKELLYNIAVINLDNPLDTVLEESDRSYLNYYADSIIKNERGKEKLFRLNIANNMLFSDIKTYGATNEEISSHLDKINIAINEENLKYLEEDTLVEYIKTRRLNDVDFWAIMKSNKTKAKLCIVRNIENIISEDALPKCMEGAVTYICANKIQLTADELLQYIKRTSADDFIKIILISKLTKEETVTVMSNFADNNLNKIQTKNALILLNNNRYNKAFARRLESFGLVKQQNSRKNKKVIRLQVS